MWITTKVSISFHPVNEYNEIQAFMKTNDMSEWKEYPSTVAITFVKEQTLFTGEENNG